MLPHTTASNRRHSHTGKRDEKGIGSRKSVQGTLFCVQEAASPSRRKDGVLTDCCQAEPQPLNILPMRKVPVNLKASLPGPSHRQRRGCLALTLLLLLFVAPPLLADSYYLAPDRPDGGALLAPPPETGSAEEAADLASARAVFKARTPAEEARAFKDASLSILLFAPAIGPFFQPGKLPNTEALFKKGKKDIAEPLDMAKDYWKRQRPYEMNKRLSLGSRSE